MKKFCLMFFACLFVAAQLHASTLIVTKEGKSFWVVSVKQKGDMVVYRSKAGAPEKSVPISGLHGVVKTVKRGKHYPPEKIDKYISKIKVLQRKHKNLYRQLNSILQEWEALKKPDPGLEAAINKVVSKYNSSDKGTSIYKKTVLDLGMVKFKDMQGKYSGKIDAKVEEVKADYVKVNKDRIIQTAADPSKLNIDQYLELAQLCRDVKTVAKKSDQDEIDMLHKGMRALCCKYLAQSSVKIFNSSRSVDGYLEAMRILRGVEEHVASTAAQKAGVERSITSLQSNFKRAQPSYTINTDGFVLSRSDVSLLTSNAAYSSRGRMSGLKEEAIIIAEKPVAGSVSRQFSPKLRVALKRGQPEDRIFAVRVYVRGEEEGASDFKELGKLSFKNGHAALNYSGNFSKLSSAAPVETGGYNASFVLLYKHTDNTGTVSWVPVAKSCHWNFSK